MTYFYRANDKKFVTHKVLLAWMSDLFLQSLFFKISLTNCEWYKQFTFWWSDRTIWGKLANWKSTKKMSWLERCCHRSWLVPPSSNFSSVSDRSMAYTTRSTSWSSSTGQRCLCCKAEIRYSIPKALPLTSQLVQLQLQYSILTEGWEAWNEVWT